MKPARKRELVEYVQAAYDVSERRGCVVLRFGRSTHRYESIRPNPCPGDFDGNGTVSTLDVLAFLNAWSGGC